MKIAELEELLEPIKFTDLSEYIAGALCEIIVYGSGCDYAFEKDVEDNSAYAPKDNKSHVLVSISDLTEELLVRSGLIEKSVDSSQNKFCSYYIFRPTQRGLALYRKFESKDMLDAEGLLKTVA